MFLVFFWTPCMWGKLKPMRSRYLRRISEFFRVCMERDSNGMGRLIGEGLPKRMIGWYVYTQKKFGHKNPILDCELSWCTLRSSLIFATNTWLAEAPDKPQKPASPGLLAVAMACSFLLSSSYFLPRMLISNSDVYSRGTYLLPFFFFPSKRCEGKGEGREMGSWQAENRIICRFSYPRHRGSCARRERERRRQVRFHYDDEDDKGTSRNGEILLS